MGSSDSRSSSRRGSSQSFEESMSGSDLPPPGPSHYAARRALWLSSQRISNSPSTNEESSSNESPCPRREPSTSCRRLERLLLSPDAVRDDTVWKNGIERVWRGLNAGKNLRHRLPLDLVIKVVHAAWLRDNTWPIGMYAPEPDDVLDHDYDTLFTLDGSTTPQPVFVSYTPATGVVDEPAFTPFLDYGDGKLVSRE